MNVDILVFGAHPDDAELGCGGILCKMKSDGYTTGIIDMTRGEMGSRGTPEIRTEEAGKSAKILGLDVRKNLEMQDGKLDTDFESRMRIVDIIRELRPSIIIASHPEDRHPDHTACGELVRSAFFNARLKKLETENPAFAPKRLFFYPAHFFVSPVVCIDVSPFFEQKMEALRAYESQFILGRNEKLPTPIGVDDHIFHTESRMRHFGSQVNVRYAEGVVTEIPILVDNLLDLT